MSRPVDYSNEAITARIRRLSEASRHIDPFEPRIDMSGEAIGQRLREVAMLCQLGSSLAAAGRDERARERES